MRNVTLRVPVKPSQEDCSECGRRATKQAPHFEYSVVRPSLAIEISGVMCFGCLHETVKEMNEALSVIGLSVVVEEKSKCSSDEDEQDNRVKGKKKQEEKKTGIGE